MSSKYGIVYVLSNDAMPGIVKIGMTLRNDVTSRMKELYGTGVPLPFNLEYACSVESSKCWEVENALHTAFEPYRVNPNREFFRINAKQAVSILKIIDTNSDDLTDEISDEIASSIDPMELGGVSDNISNNLPFNNIVGTFTNSEKDIIHTIISWLEYLENGNDKIMVNKLSDGFIRFSFATRWWNICRIKLRLDSLNVKICKEALSKNSESITLPDIDSLETIKEKIVHQAEDSKKRCLDFRLIHNC